MVFWGTGFFQHSVNTLNACRLDLQDWEQLLMQVAITKHRATSWLETVYTKKGKKINSEAFISFISVSLIIHKHPEMIVLYKLDAWRWLNPYITENIEPNLLSLLWFSNDNKTTVAAGVNIYAIDLKGQRLVYIRLPFFTPLGKRTSWRCERATHVKWDLKGESWGLYVINIWELFRGKTSLLKCQAYAKHFLRDYEMSICHAA